MNPAHSFTRAFRKLILTFDEFGKWHFPLGQNATSQFGLDIGRSSFWVAIVGGLGMGFTLTLGSVMAQTSPLPSTAGSAQVADCAPPSANEFLLLVVTPTPDSQGQVKRLIPEGVNATVCHYVNQIVTRLGGFRNLDAANSWAQYIQKTTELQVFVARSPQTNPAQTAQTPPLATPTPPPQPNATPPQASVNPVTQRQPQGSLAYAPRLLNPGYAVLVSYYNQPEIAKQVQQVLGREVGLVAYRQRPFLLALYTTDQAVANATLHTLSNQGFFAALVDSRNVVLLRSSIRLN